MIFRRKDKTMETYRELILQHHGIKGQKWGVRKYQNKNGTLTAAGKRRYGDDVPDRLKKRYKHSKTISFRNASREEQKSRNRTTIANTLLYGKKRARVMNYNVYEQNKSMKDERKKETKRLIRNVIIGSVISSAITHAGRAYIKGARNVYLNNVINMEVARQNGLKTIDGGRAGLSTIMGSISRGQQVYERLTNG